MRNKGKGKQETRELNEENKGRQGTGVWKQRRRETIQLRKRAMLVPWFPNSHSLKFVLNNYSFLPFENLPLFTSFIIDSHEKCRGRQKHIVKFRLSVNYYGDLSVKFAQPQDWLNLLFGFHSSLYSTA